MEGKDDRYFSITNVLSKTLPNDGLINWQRRVGIEKANEITRKAASRGVAVHSYCEQYLLNEIIYPPDGYDSNFETFLDIKKHLDNCIDNVYGVELPLYSTELLIAGTPDCIAEYNGKLSIIDFKTAKNRSKIIIDKLKKYLLQCTAYSMMVENLHGIKIDNCVILFGLEEQESYCLSLPITNVERSALRSICERFRESV